MMARGDPEQLALNDVKVIETLCKNTSVLTDFCRTHGDDFLTYTTAELSSCDDFQNYLEDEWENNQDVLISLPYDANDPDGDYFPVNILTWGGIYWVEADGSESGFFVDLEIAKREAESMQLVF